jgi:serine/threonine protein kinase
MGEVFLAMSGHREMETLCVVKRLLPALASRPEHVRRFRHEADLARRLVHSNLVHTHNIGEVDGEVFLVQEFVEGRDVSALIEEMTAEHRVLPVGVALYIAGEIARGLSYAHAFEKLDLVHRDINLPNVRLTFSGEVKLLDFGIASSNLHGGAPGQHGTAGKLWHLAPEQARLGGKIDCRTDIYALGVVLWELLTQRPIGTVVEDGREVRQPQTEGEIMAWIVRGEHLPPSAFNREVPTGLDVLVGRAMSVLPDHRPASADELRGALAAFIPAGFDAEEHLSGLMKDLFPPDRERSERHDLIEAGRRLLDRDSGTRQEIPRARIATPAKPVPKSKSKKSVWIAPIGVGAVLGLALLLWLHRDSPDLARRSVPEPVAPTVATPSQKPAPPAAIPTLKLTQPLVAGVQPLPRAMPDADSQRPAREKTSHGEGTTAAPSPPEKVDHLSAARQAFNDRDWPNALGEGKKAVAAGGGADVRADAHAILGNTYFKMGRFADAEKEYARAAELDPENQLMQQRLRIARARAHDDIRGEAP